MKKLLILFTVFLACCPAGGANNLVKEANQAYADQDFSRAVALYDSVIATGVESAQLYYNLGNAWFRQDEIAPAILYYERALQLDPSAVRIRHNLEYVKQFQKNEIEQLPVMFYVRWWHSLTRLFSVRGWAMASIIFIAISSLLWMLFIVSRNHGRRKVSFWAATASTLLFILVFFITLRNYNHLQQEKNAIIFEPVVTGKSSPDETSKDLFVIHEGLKVHIMDKIGNWYEVRLPDGTVGWLPAESMRVI